MNVNALRNVFFPNYIRNAFPFLGRHFLYNFKGLLLDKLHHISLIPGTDFHKIDSIFKLTVMSKRSDSWFPWKDFSSTASL